MEGSGPVFIDQNNPTRFQFSPDWLPIDKDYKCIRLMGECTFGEVMLAMSYSSHQFVAIKKIQLDSDCYKSRRVLAEIQILRQLAKMKTNQFTANVIDI